MLISPEQPNCLSALHIFAFFFVQTVGPAILVWMGGWDSHNWIIKDVVNFRFNLTRSFFFLSGVMKPFLAFFPAAWASSLARTSAFFRSISDILLQKKICLVRQIIISSSQLINHIKVYTEREHRLTIRCSFTYSSSPILVARPELKEPPLFLLDDAHRSPSSLQVAQHSGRTGQGAPAEK